MLSFVVYLTFNIDKRDCLFCHILLFISPITTVIDTSYIDNCGCMFYCVLLFISAVNASYLGKSGAVSYIFKILAMCGKKHLTLLKYTLDTLALLVKSSKTHLYPSLVQELNVGTVHK